MKSMPRISRAVQRHMLKLLNMEYKPSEIAGELNVKPKTIYNFIDLGCPCRTDKAGNIWIVGTSFIAWANDQLTLSKNRPRVPIAEDQAYCFHCQTAVKFEKTITKAIGVRTVTYGLCVVCGGKVAKFGGRQNDQ